jgi:hypothetical protein
VFKNLEQGFSWWNYEKNVFPSPPCTSAAQFAPRPLVAPGLERFEISSVMLPFFYASCDISKCGLV